MIRTRLDYLLLDNRMKLKDLAEATGLALNNLSILKTNKARTIRFSTLAIYKVTEHAHAATTLSGTTSSGIQTVYALLRHYPPNCVSQR